jgi:hypothetical protein
MRGNVYFRPKSLSPATVISAIALFVALGGVGYGASGIGSSQIKDNSIQSSDIKNNSIASSDIKDKTIAVKDLANGTVAALKGAKGPAGPAGSAGPAGPAGGVGPAGRSALSNLQSGERIFGVYALQGQGPNLWTAITFPVPAPLPVDSLHVVIANNDTITGDGCTGTTSAPVSSPGYVCMYPHLSVNTTSGFGWGALCSCGDATATGDGSRFGFIVQANGAGLITASGVWVYTSP